MTNLTLGLGFYVSKLLPKGLLSSKPDAEKIPGNRNGANHWASTT
jgi:hypothetical protein